MLQAQRAPRVEAQELIARPQPVERVLLALEEQEAPQVAAVRLQDDRLEALDLPSLLQLGVVLGHLAEELQGLLLAPARRCPPADEECPPRHRRTSCPMLPCLPMPPVYPRAVLTRQLKKCSIPAHRASGARAHCAS